MRGIFIWGAGLNGIVDAADPDMLKNASVSWNRDSERLAPWSAVTLPVDGTAYRCWAAAADCEYPPLIVSGPCSSAMDLSWYFVQRGFLPEWGSILAVSQWAGRGQLGSEWISPIGNIYGAIRIPALSRAWRDMVPLVTGYALLRSLGRMGVAMQLKWPNDLLIQNKKVGGVLIESKGGVTIAGAGLNLSSSPDAEKLRGDDAVPAASLSGMGYGFTPLALWRHLVKDMQDFFNTMIRTGHPERLVRQIQPHLAFAGKTVGVAGFEGDRYQATLTGLTPDGGLALSTGKETKILRSGRINLLADRQGGGN